MMGVRIDIVDAVVDALETITQGNGFNTDYGNSVGEWLDYEDPANVPDELQVRDPVCSPRDPDEEDDNTAEKHHKTLELHIVFFKKGKTTPGHLRKGIEDVLKAIGSITWPDGVVKARWGGDSTNVEEQNKIFGGTSVVIYVDYVTSAWAD